MSLGHLQSASRRRTAERGTDCAMSYLPLHLSSRFGARLRVLLQQRQLSQRRMAASFGFNRGFIEDLELGRRPVSLSLLEVLALVLNLPLPELLKDL